MALLTVGVSSGVANSGTGTVSTLDNLVSAAGIGSPQILSVQGSTGTALAIPVSQASTFAVIASTAGFTVQPGNTANTTPWLSKIHDGTNPFVLKATAPTTGDQAIVVAISPNGILAAGQGTKATSNPVVIASDQSSIPVAGDVAAASSDSGNPLKVGGIGHTANPTAVTDGQRVNAMFDKLGKQVVVGSVRDLKTDATATTSTTAEGTILAAVASTFLDVYSFWASNTSTQAITVSFRDATGGSVRFGMLVPAGDVRGWSCSESAAIKQTTVNNNWTTTLSSALTSGGITTTILAVKNI